MWDFLPLTCCLSWPDFLILVFLCLISWFKKNNNNNKIFIRNNPISPIRRFLLKTQNFTFFTPEVQNLNSVSPRGAQITWLYISEMHALCLLPSDFACIWYADRSKMTRGGGGTRRTWLLQPCTRLWIGSEPLETGKTDSKISSVSHLCKHSSDTW